MKFKKGNIAIFYFAFAISLVITIFVVTIIYIQIDIQAKSLKEDINRTVINAALINCDEEALRLFEYRFNIENMKKDILILLKKDNKLDITINELYYDEKNNNFAINLSFRFIPLIHFKILQSMELKIEERVKFKSMEVINK